MRRRLLAALILASASAAVACAPSDDGSDPGEPVNIRVGANRLILTNAPLIIAEAEGFFAEQGLRVEIVAIPQSTSQVAPTLARGGLDVLAGGFNAGLFNAIARGAPIRLVAEKGHIDPDRCTTNGLVGRRSLVESGELADLRRIRHRRVAVNPKSSSGYAVERLLAPFGLTLDDIETVQLPNPSLVDALDRGAVDLAWVEEPWVTHLTSAGHTVLLSSLPRDFAAIIFGPTLLEKNPDAGRRFMVAYLEGVRRYLEGKTERNLEVLARATGMDADLLERACWPAVRGDGRLDTGSVVDFQRWAVRQGLLARSAPTEEFWDPAFVEHANRVLAEEER